MSINLDKKVLANRIKTDLRKEISGGDLSELSDYGLVADNDNIFSISEYFTCSLHKNFFKPSDFEKEDYDEIVNLIRQRLQLRAQELVKEKKKKEKILDSNPKLFYHSACARYKAGVYEEKGMSQYHQFWGRKNGQDYNVNVTINHPALNNVIFSDKFSNPKKRNFYLIKGVENLPSEPNIPQHWEVEGRFFKWVELENNITITLTNEKKDKVIGLCNKCSADYRNVESWYYWCEENEAMTSLERLSWFCGKCWKSEEKKYRQKSNPKNTVYKNEPQKNNLGDEHYYYFENGRWVSLESGTLDPNTTGIHAGDRPLPKTTEIWEKEWKDKKNKTARNIHIDVLIEWFKSRNIKSIQVIDPTWSLSITYNNGKNKILNNENQKNSMILNCLRHVDEKNLDQQKIEKLKNSYHSYEIASEKNQPKPSYAPYLIGGGIIVVTLGTGWIVYCLKNQKMKK